MATIPIEYISASLKLPAIVVAPPFSRGFLLSARHIAHVVWFYPRSPISYLRHFSFRACTDRNRSRESSLYVRYGKTVRYRIKNGSLWDFCIPICDSNPLR